MKFKSITKIATVSVLLSNTAGVFAQDETAEQKVLDKYAGCI